MSARGTWIKLSDSFPTDPRVLEAGEPAAYLFIVALCYAGEHMTDGLVPKAALRRLVDGDVELRAAKLVEVGLWEEEGASYRIIRYLDHQTSRAEIEDKRARGREKQARYIQKKTLTPVESAEAEVDAATVRSRLTTVCDQAVVDGNSEATLEGYRHVYEKLVPQAAEKYAAVKGIGEASLLNGVVLHAAAHYLGDIDQATMRRLAAMRRDFGFLVIEKLPIAAVAAKGDPLSYLTTLIKKETSNVH